MILGFTIVLWALLNYPRDQAALQVEQDPLAPQSAAVPALTAVRIDDTVTGNHDGNGIRPIRKPDRARREDVARYAEQRGIHTVMRVGADGGVTETTI